MQEYPKRLYLDDGTRVTVADAAEERRWRGQPDPAPADPEPAGDPAPAEA